MQFYSVQVRDELSENEEDDDDVQIIVLLIFELKRAYD